MTIEDVKALYEQVACNDFFGCSEEEFVEWLDHPYCKLVNRTWKFPEGDLCLSGQLCGDDFEPDELVFDGSDGKDYSFDLREYNKQKAEQYAGTR